MNSEITENDIALTRNYIIEEFSQLEEQINVMIFNFYKKAECGQFTEDLLMSGANGFCFKMELLEKIILHHQATFTGIFPSKTSIKNFLEYFRKCNTIRNYFAHTSFFTRTNNGLFRGYNSVDFTVNISDEKKKFSKNRDKIWEIFQKMNHLFI